MVGQNTLECVSSSVQKRKIQENLTKTMLSPCVWRYTQLRLCTILGSVRNILRSVINIGLKNWQPTERDEMNLRTTERANHHIQWASSCSCQALWLQSPREDPAFSVGNRLSSTDDFEWGLWRVIIRSWNVSRLPQRAVLRTQTWRDRKITTRKNLQSKNWYTNKSKYSKLKGEINFGCWGSKNNQKRPPHPRPVQATLRSSHIPLKAVGNLKKIWSRGMIWSDLWFLKYHSGYCTENG